MWVLLKISTRTHGIVLKLIRKWKVSDINCSSSQPFWDLYSRKTNSRDTVRHSRKVMPANLEPKMLKMKKGDLLCKMEKRHQCSLLEIQMGSVPSRRHPPVPPHRLIMWTVREMPQNHYALKVATATWVLLTWAMWLYFLEYLEMKKKILFFHLVDLSVLGAFIIHCWYGGTLNRKLFRERLVSGFIHAAQDKKPTSFNITPWPAIITSSSCFSAWLQAINISGLSKVALGDVVCVSFWKFKDRFITVRKAVMWVSVCNHDSYRITQCCITKKSRHHNQLHFLWRIFTYSACSGEFINWDNTVNLTRHIATKVILFGCVTETQFGCVTWTVRMFSVKGRNKELSASGNESFGLGRKITELPVRQDER